MGKELIVFVSHPILTLMEGRGQYWLTNACMIRYQEMCGNLYIHLEVVWTSNPKTLVFAGLDQQDMTASKSWMMSFLTNWT